MMHKFHASWQYLKQTPPAQLFIAEIVPSVHLFASTLHRCECCCTAGCLLGALFLLLSNALSGRPHQLRFKFRRGSLHETPSEKSKGDAVQGEMCVG